MPDSFLDPLFERMAREQRAGMRIGTLTAIDTPNLSVTVNCAGDNIPGVRWVGSYAPVVGDIVVVSRVGAAWVVLGKTSKQIVVAPLRYGSVLIVPAPGLAATRDILPVPGGWGWNYDGGSLHQGRLVWPSLSYEQAGIALYPGGIAQALPVGATVTSVKVQFQRSAVVYDEEGAMGNRTELVSPVIYGHAQTAQPTTQDPSTLWVAGFGPWRPGTLARGQSGQWDLPSTWVTALLAGTLRGIGTYSTDLTDHTWWINAAILTVYYSTPA